VVPVATDSGLFWGRRAFRKRPGTITIAVRPAIPAGQPRAALARQLAAAIELEPNQPRAAMPVDKPVETAATALRP
jgi:1-acyl-sn-glycerol-3-phosphate acyltransferase